MNKVGKVNPNGGEWTTWGGSFCCVGALCPKCVLGTLGRVLVAFLGLWGLEAQIMKKTTEPVKFGLRAFGESFGPQSPGDFGPENHYSFK